MFRFQESQMSFETIISMHNTALVRLTRPQSVGVFILNLLIPGSGTAAIGIFGAADLKNNLLLGLLMFVLAPLWVGWIWSVVFGV